MGTEHTVNRLRRSRRRVAVAVRRGIRSEALRQLDEVRVKQWVRPEPRPFSRSWYDQRGGPQPFSGEAA